MDRGSEFSGHIGAEYLDVGKIQGFPRTMYF